jgi:hypothetical protein
MFSKCHLGGRLGSIAVLALLLGWAGARPAHANISLFVNKVAVTNGGSVTVTGTVIVDEWSYINPLQISLQQNLPGGNTAYGSVLWFQFLGANAPWTFVITVPKYTSSPSFEPGNARITVRVTALDSSFKVRETAETGGPIKLKGP